MVAYCRVGGSECSSTGMGSFEGGHHYLHYLHHSSKRRVKVKLLSRVQFFVAPYTVAYQAPRSMEFSRQEYWSGLLFPSPWDLPNPGIEPSSPTLQTDSFSSEPPGKPIVWPQVNSREGTQLHPSTENWIKDLLSMAPPIRTKPSFPLSHSLPTGSFHKPLILLHQRADRLKTTITEN